MGDQEVESEYLIGTYLTKPLPPTNFKLGESNQILWTKSPTPRVGLYRVKLKSIEEGSRPQEFLIDSSQDNEPGALVLQDLVLGLQYRVNIYAVVQMEGFEPVESKELHEKIIMTEEGVSIYTEEVDQTGDHD